MVDRFCKQQTLLVWLFPSGSWLSPLSLSSGSPKYYLPQQAPSPSRSNGVSFKNLLSSHKDFLSLFTHASTPTNPPPPFLPREIQSGNVTPVVVTAMHCQYQPSFPVHADQLFHCLIHDTCTVTHYAYSPVLMSLTRFPPFNLDLYSFLTLPIYSVVIFPFIEVLRVWSNCKMSRYLVGPFHFSSKTAHLSSPNDFVMSS